MEAESAAADGYQLDRQIGYLLRLASQRHAVIFQENMTEDLTPTQFSTLIRLSEHGAVSQNHLGRLAAMDAATTKGVVDRLKGKSLVTSESDPSDKRRSVIFLTERGKALIEELEQLGAEITEKTLAPLKAQERRTLVSLLERLS